jgi:hypothetical protein
MSDQVCLIEGCSARAYAPAGTASLCKTHFLAYLAWRRKRGAGLFAKYAAMTMEERDAIVAEWRKSVTVEEPPSPQPAQNR